MINNDVSSRNCCRRVVLRSHNQGQNVEFDGSPVGFKTVLVRKRDRSMVIEHVNEGKTCDRDLDEFQEDLISTKRRTRIMS